MITNISQLLELTVQRQASDLHILVNFPPTLRINGDLIAVDGLPNLEPADIQSLLVPILSKGHNEQLNKFLDVDFGLEFKDIARFRV